MQGDLKLRRHVEGQKIHKVLIRSADRGGWQTAHISRQVVVDMTCMEEYRVVRDI